MNIIHFKSKNLQLENVSYNGREIVETKDSNTNFSAFYSKLNSGDPYWRLDNGEKCLIGMSLVVIFRVHNFYSNYKE